MLCPHLKLRFFTPQQVMHWLLCDVVPSSGVTISYTLAGNALSSFVLHVSIVHCEEGQDQGAVSITCNTFAVNGRSCSHLCDNRLLRAM